MAAQAAEVSAADAQVRAGDAETAATQAQADASSAQAEAAQASIDAAASVLRLPKLRADAQTASQAAQDAAADAEDAQSDAAQAVTDASNALGIANTASANASTALSTANNAESTANSADAKADTAITDSADAVSTANAAAAAVSDVVTYTIVADVASIPSSPGDGDRIEVTDSTGIESFSPLSGVPASYVGDSGKAARISYAAATWSWVNYVVIDPDARYATISGQTFTGTVAAPSFSGPLTGDVTGDTSGTHTGPVTGDVTGNTAGTHTGPVTGDVTGTADNSNFVQVGTSGFGPSSERPIACFSTTSTPINNGYTNIKYPESNIPTVTGAGVLKAPGGFEGDLTGTASLATDADTVDGIHAASFARVDSATTFEKNTYFSASVVLGPYTRINDDASLYFGNDNDARQWTNGSHLYLDLNSGIGNFYIRDGTTTRFTFDDAGDFIATGDIQAGGNIACNGTISGTMNNTSVRNAIANSSSVGNKGTYALLTINANNDKQPGGTVNSGYRYADASGGITTNTYPNGTWRLMGRTAGQSTAFTEKQTSVFLRIFLIMSLYRLPNGEIEFGEPKRLPTGQIKCLVKLVDFDNEVAEFVASPDDSEDYGRELYEMLDTKYRSQVCDCSQEDLDEDAKCLVKHRRNRELADSDWLMTVDSPATNIDEWKVYRQALRDISKQPGYPHAISWPAEPEFKKA